MDGKAVVAQSIPNTGMQASKQRTPPPQGKASLSLSPSRVAFSILLVTSWYSQQSPSGLTGLPHMWASADQVRRMTQLCVLKAPRLGTEWAHQME